MANVGVDLTGQMLIPFHNDYFVQLIIMLLIVVGGIGFPVLLEVKDFLQYRRTKKSFHFGFHCLVKSPFLPFLFYYSGSTLYLAFRV